MDNNIAMPLTTKMYSSLLCADPGSFVMGGGGGGGGEGPTLKTLFVCFSLWIQSISDICIWSRGNKTYFMLNLTEH